MPYAQGIKAVENLGKHIVLIEMPTVGADVFILQDMDRFNVVSQEFHRNHWRFLLV